MKYKIMPLLSLIIPYLLFPILFVLRFFPDLGETVVFGVPIILWTILLLLPLTLLYLWFTRKRLPVQNSVYWNFVLKLGLIPFSLLFFLLCIFLPLIVPVVLVFDVVLMLTSSAYGIRSMHHLWRTGKISTKFFLFNCILHLMFVADVISAVILYSKFKHMEITNDLHGTDQQSHEDRLRRSSRPGRL